MERSLIIAGFPESGKTTYLAALWSILTARLTASSTTLRFESLGEGEFSHLNAIAQRWLDGFRQFHTEIPGNKVVQMNLLGPDQKPVRLAFPDLSGESYRHMFEERECDRQVAQILTSGQGMLYFIHSDTIRPPQLITTVMQQSQALGAPIPPNQYVPWSPRLAPTGVQTVDLLQLLRAKPVQVPFGRLAIVLSAWDKVAEENRTPKEFVAERLPLLNQYLHSGADNWDWKIYGVSAQGADYEKEKEELSPAQQAKLDAVRSLDDLAERITVICDERESHDLTEPLSWLMS
jgi:hypothetical protein